MSAPMKTCDSNMSSSDSDTSDDEDVSRLKEAAVSYLPVSKSNTSAKQLDQVKIGNTKDKKTKEAATNKPSLRPKEKTHDDENELQTTPEFRAHIAKKLSAVLDRSVEITASSETPNIPKPSGEENVDLEFKLFSTSVPGVKEETAPKRRRLPSSSSDSSDDDRFQACAVTGDSILAQSGFSKIAYSSKALLEPTNSTNNGDHEEVEQCKIKKKKKKKRNKEVSETESTDNVTATDTNQNESLENSTSTDHKKHKKKKKKSKEQS